MKLFFFRACIIALAVSAALLPAACEPVTAGAPASAVSTSAPAATEPATKSPAPIPSATPEPTVVPTPTAAPPTATPTLEPTAPPDPVEEILSGMSDEELLGQMVMLGFQGKTGMPANVAGLFTKYKAGGVMLFGWNVSSFEQAKKLIAKINARNACPELPLLIAIDEEGGAVKRFAWSPPLRSAATLGKGDPEEAYRQFLRVGKKLKETGINLNFAPVLDIAPNPAGTFLGKDKRMYGTDPDRVIPITDAVIRGLHDGGIFSLGKHFPGHGNTATDSHKSLPVINDSMKRLAGYSLKPFEAAVDSGIDAMLVGHLLVPALDGDNPASLSERIITGLLRGELGFNGVVFSDDMRMGAITSNYDIGEACVRFVEAGGDVLLIGKYTDKQARALAALDGAVQSGRITRDRLLESARRIVALKLRIKASFERPS